MAKDKKGAKAENGVLGRLFGSKPATATPTSRFETTPEQALAKIASLPPGHMHVLNLRDLVTRRYADPEPMLKKAGEIAFAVIDENLREGDSFARQNDGTFVFLFPTQNKDVGELKCSVIAAQIARKLKGDDTPPAATKSKTKTKTAASTTPVGKPVDPTKPSAAKVEGYQEVRQYREAEERAKWATRAMEAMTPSKDLPETKIADWYEPASPGAAGSSKSLVCLFRPMWHVRNKLLTAYCCLPIQPMPNGKVVLGTGILGKSGTPGAKARLDQFALEKCVEALKKLLADERKLLVVAPVHFSTVDTQTYGAGYFRTVTNLSEEARKFLVLQLIDAPTDILQRRLQETVAKMRVHARTVLGRVDPDSTDLARWKEIGLHAVGFDLLDHPMPEKAALAELDRFAAHAEQQGLRSFAFGLESLSLATGAVAAGFDYVEGNAVHSPVVTPESILRFEFDDMYAPLLD